MNSRICLIGYGYWGKILHKTLKSMGCSNVVVVDQVLENLNEINENFSHYFIATNFESHIDVIKKLSKFRDKKIWCEKPLVRTLSEANEVYNQTLLNNNKLFVDWTYTYNPCVIAVKKLVGNRKLKQIILNRTNDGPLRTDCTSIFDLSSHDLSIIYYILECDTLDFNWNEFSIKSNEKFGSNLSWYYNDGTQIILNSSWQHKSKNRISTFLTEDDEIIIFDDLKKTVTSNSGIENFQNSPSPLESAIKNFFDGTTYEQNQDITLKVTKNLCNLTI